MEYSWHLVGVLDYSKVKCQYLVERVHQNSKDEQMPVLNEERKKSKSPGWSLCCYTIVAVQYCPIISACLYRPLFVMLTIYCMRVFFLSLLHRGQHIGTRY